jgi:hypothetical protein
MAKEPIQFPKPKTPDPPFPGATQGSRVIFGIGGQRFAVDLYRKVTALNAEPGTVVPMKLRTRRPATKPKKK